MKCTISILLGFFLLLCSCTSSKKVVVSLPQFPDSLGTLPKTEMDIPIRIDARPIFAKAESLVPKEFFSDQWPNYTPSGCDFRYKYHFLRSPLLVTCVNNRINVEFTGSYQIAGSKCICAMNKPATPWLSGSCGFGNEGLRKSTISISSQLNFLPGYHLISSTRAEKVEAIDKCTVSLLSSDVTQLVMDSIRSAVNFFCSSLDQTIAGTDLSPIVNQLGNQFLQANRIGKYGYVQIHPSVIRIGKLDYAKDTIALSLGVTCSPVFYSDSLPKVTQSLLPPLTALPANRSGIKFYAQANYSYPFLSKLMTDTLRDKVFTINGRTVVIKEVGIRGLGHHQVEIRIDFTGSNTGRIYLRGTPVLDSTKQSLSVPDISYTLDSKDVLLNIGKSLFRNKIKKSIKGKSYLDIAALVKTNLPVITGQVNRKLTANLSSSGSVYSIRLLGLLPRDNDIQVQIFADAEINILSTGILK